VPILHEPYAYSNFPVSIISAFCKFGVRGWILVPAVFFASFYRAVHVHAMYIYLHSLGRSPKGGCTQACRQHIAEVKPPGCSKKFCSWGRKRDGDKKHLSLPVTVIVSWFLLS